MRHELASLKGPAAKVQVERQQQQKLEQAARLLLLLLLVQLQSRAPAVLLRRLLPGRSKVQVQHLLLQFYQEPPDRYCPPLDLFKKGILWALKIL